MTDAENAVKVNDKLGHCISHLIPTLRKLTQYIASSEVLPIQVNPNSNTGF